MNLKKTLKKEQKSVRHKSAPSKVLKESLMELLSEIT